MKKLLALVLALVMTLSLCTISNAAFTDAKDVDASYEEAVAVLNGMGVFKGYEDGSFKPEGSITRAEVAAIVYRLYTGDVKDKQTGLYAGYGKFDDMAGAAWAAGYIGFCANAGFVKGYGDGKFGPSDPVTGYQALAMILRAVGYGKNGEFEGADWELHVAQIAQQLKVLKNVKGVSLKAAASRELVAELLFQVAAYVPTVTYTPAFGYSTLTGVLNIKEIDSLDKEIGTLGWKNFNLKKTTAGTEDDFGRPSTKWFSDDDKDGKVDSKETVYATVAAKPVVTYTVAVNGCDLLVDIGYATTDDTKVKIEKYVDGYSNTGSLVHTHDTNKCKVKDYTFGGQGALTEVYEMDDDNYRIVTINTYLAKIGKTVVAKNNHNGDDYVKLTVWTAENPVDKTYTYETGTESYTKDAYALVTMAKGVIQSVEEVEPVDTAKLKAYNTKKATTTVGDTTYDQAAKYFCGKQGTIGTKYCVFVDNYGNIIGLVLPAEADAQYTFLYQGIAVTGGWDARYEAKIVDTDANIETVVVDKYNANEPSWTDNKPVDVRKIVSYTLNSDDEYDLEDAEVIKASSVENGSTRIRDKEGAIVAVADAETAYLVETDNGVFSAYTGYKAVPSIAGAAIQVLVGEDGYAELVYIDARNATYEGNSTYALILKSAADVGDGNNGNNAYDIVSNVVIDGETASVDVKSSYTSAFLGILESYSKGAAVKLFYDTDGLVIRAEPIKDFKAGTVAHKTSDGEVIYFEGDTKGYVADEDSVLWVIEGNDAEVFELDDLSARDEDHPAADTVYFTTQKDGETFEYVVWYK